MKKQTDLNDSPIKISIIVPAYNEGKNIPKILQMLFEVEQVLPSMEIIVIDDGSTDETPEAVSRFSNVRYIRHQKNLGKGAALATGFDASMGNVVVVQDADLEYSPYDIPKLVKPILSGEADVVFGSRFKGSRSGMKFMNFLGNVLLSSATKLLLGLPTSDVMTGYKIFSRKVIESMTLKEDGFNIESEIAAKIFFGGWKFTEVPITYIRRSNGMSKFRFYKDGLNSFFKLVHYRIDALARGQY